MALSRSICLLMGYELIVESEEGKGSTFKIVMGERAKRPEKADEAGSDVLTETPEPSIGADAFAAAASIDNGTGGVASGKGVVPEVQTAPTATMRDFQVLVIDDEKDSRVLMVHYLEELGCRVITAEGGEQGIAAAHKHTLRLG